MVPFAHVKETHVFEIIPAKICNEKENDIGKSTKSYSTAFAL